MFVSAIHRSLWSDVIYEFAFMYSMTELEMCIVACRVFVVPFCGKVGTRFKCLEILVRCMSRVTYCLEEILGLVFQLILGDKI